MPPPQAAFPVFANEILGLFCDHADEATLVALCKTSSVFKFFAQPLLFEHVNLGWPMRIVEGWCAAIERNAGLAKRVLSLALTLPPLLDHGIGHQIVVALQACLNLTDLSFFAAEGADRSADASILVGLPFKLVTFRNSYFLWEPAMERFLADQPSIRFICAPWLKGVEDRGIWNFLTGSDPRLLPNLVGVSADSPIYLPAYPERPLQRIATTFNGGYVGFLASYAATLTTLSLTTDHFQLSLSVTLDSLADAVPTLVHIALEETSGMGGSWGGSSRPLSAFIHLFPRLETFVLFATSVTFDMNGARSPSHSWAELLDFDPEAALASIRDFSIGHGPTLASLWDDLDADEHMEGFWPRSASAVETAASGVGTNSSESNSSPRTLEPLSFEWEGFNDNYTSPLWSDLQAILNPEDTGVEPSPNYELAREAIQANPTLRCVVLSMPSSYSTSPDTDVHIATRDGAGKVDVRREEGTDFAKYSMFWA
ncbi:F-box domain-containing protein [Mycena kentingensis (nom. inval.)]|nr:F-box domain-containing protein [Mycena kentingensis (nom. inval.)]